MADLSSRPMEPVFVLGNPRSGTTMLRLMLTSHPLIGIPPESDFIVRLFPRFGHQRALSQADAIALGKCLAGNPVDLAEHWEVPLDALIGDGRGLTGLSYAEACAEIYLGYRRAKGLPSALLWGDKNNAYGHYIDLLARLFPAGRFIHLVRDGRAVLNSYRMLDATDDTKYAPILPKDARAVALRWSDTVGRVDRHLARYAANRSISLRYEDLVSDPEGQARRLCGFLSVPYEAEMLDFHIKNAEQALEPRKYGWKANTFKPLDVAKRDAWRTKLSPETLAEFEAIAGPTLRRQSYDVTAGPRGAAPGTWRFRLNARMREAMRHARVVGVGLRQRFAG